MLKIVEVRPSATACGEYVVLQNQGLTTVSLRGWALCSDAYLGGDPYEAAREMYIFSEDVPVKPYTRVVLFTGAGEPGWYPTNDGKSAYVEYWQRQHPAWGATGAVHLLHLACSRRLPQPTQPIEPAMV